MICQFKDNYYFMSNFYPFKLIYNGIEYQNTEAAFQAQKCKYLLERNQFSKLNPSEAKRLGRRVELRPDWEQVKDGIMYNIVLTKFSSDEYLAYKLLETGEEVLMEGNTWKDTYWGVDLDTMQGKNKLGLILMKVRDVLRAKIN